MTRYLVLKKSEAGWVIYGDDVQASGERAAIKACAEAGGAGDYVAVPHRSWKPRTVSVSREPVVKIGAP